MKKFKKLAQVIKGVNMSYDWTIYYCQYCGHLKEECACNKFCPTCSKEKSECECKKNSPQ